MGAITAEMWDRIDALLKTGDNSTNIAAKVGVSSATVSRVKRGLCKRPAETDWQRIEQILTLRKQGNTYTKIAQVVGLSVSAVSRICSNHLETRKNASFAREDNKSVLCNIKLRAEHIKNSMQIGDKIKIKGKGRTVVHKSRLVFGVDMGGYTEDFTYTELARSSVYKGGV